MVLKDSARIYFQQQLTHRIPVPFRTAKVWSLPGGRGLLFLRASTSPLEDALPRLFTLTHPLDDFRPVHLSCVSGPLTGALQWSAVYVDAQLPLLVMYHWDTRQHSFWRLHRRSDVPCSTATSSSSVASSVASGMKAMRSMHNTHHHHHQGIASSVAPEEAISNLEREGLMNEQDNMDETMQSLRHVHAEYEIDCVFTDSQR